MSYRNPWLNNLPMIHRLRIHWNVNRHYRHRHRHGARICNTRRYVKRNATFLKRIGNEKSSVSIYLKLGQDSYCFKYLQPHMWYTASNKTSQQSHSLPVLLYFNIIHWNSIIFLSESWFSIRRMVFKKPRIVFRLHILS